MKFYSQRSPFSIILILSLSVAGLYALGSNGKAVSMKVQNMGKSLEVELKINKGFGVQKKGPHEITIYALSKNSGNEKDIAKVIAEHGKKTHEVKPLKLSGVNAKQDEEYFSTVNKFQIPVTVNGDIAVKAKFYYCSFNDSFCSVDILYTILSGK